MVVVCAQQVNNLLNLTTEIISDGICVDKIIRLGRTKNDKGGKMTWYLQRYNIYANL